MLNKLIKKFSLKRAKIESKDSYCYCNTIWNTEDNLVMLISYTPDYFEDVIELQEAIMGVHWCRNMRCKSLFSSYDEETDMKDDNGKPIWIIHKKYYLLIGGDLAGWKNMYNNIRNISNSILEKISLEIAEHCSNKQFESLIDDHIIRRRFKYNNIKPKFDVQVTRLDYAYTDPLVLMENLPKGFSIIDISNFIIVENKNDVTSKPLYDLLKDCAESGYMPDKYDIEYHIIEKMTDEPIDRIIDIILEPLYRQPSVDDDDFNVGKMPDDKLDDIFKQQYERFSIADDDVIYEDIDERLEDDEETENMRPEDMADDT